LEFTLGCPTGMVSTDCEPFPAKAAGVDSRWTIQGSDVRVTAQIYADFQQDGVAGVLELGRTFAVTTPGSVTETCSDVTAVRFTADCT